MKMPTCTSHERLTHPMADDDDLDHAREVIARAKGLSNDS